VGRLLWVGVAVVVASWVALVVYAAVTVFQEGW
jgi:hypothetical protein